ncbi:hypothetical protein SLS62_002329 [Diatrype stigma]|uniref:Uncharacterized protein n=1 Tax=Diatrype stigma TaxID=117547 RepID=A0AAN9YV37_9PEZI
MMTRPLSFALAAAALISAAAATPVPTPVQPQDLLAAPKMTTIVVQEALISAQVDDVPYVTWAPDVLPMTIINSHTDAISTSYGYNTGPTPVGGQPGPGTLAPGETVSFAVPTGWSGSIAVVDSAHPNAWMGGDTLIEGSFVVPYGSNGIAVGDIDISYV